MEKMMEVYYHHWQKCYLVDNVSNAENLGSQENQGENLGSQENQGENQGENLGSQEES